jgi:fructokinase
MGGALFGAVEAGGTKFVCAVGRGPDDVPACERIPTTTPAETLARVVAFFRTAAREHGPVTAVGVASFGPLDLDPASPTWGRITSTPKPGWSGTDLVGPLRAAFAVPVAIDTDVNGAGLAEARWGAGRGLGSLVYFTVGTGIGGGAIVAGAPLHGAAHPEMGHLRVPRHPDDAAFAGICPFHGDCLEGLASGPAVCARWGVPAEALPLDHPAWDMVGHYLGHAVAAVTMLLAPHVVVVGGGVGSSPPVLPAVRRWTRRLLAGYPATPRLAGGLEGYVVSPALGDRAGVLGALALAEEAIPCRDPGRSGAAHARE